jgi:hypothetical protein
MQHWSKEDDQCCNFWQLVHLEPRALLDWRHHVGALQRIASTSHQQTQSPSGQRPSIGIQPSAPAPYQEQIGAQTSHVAPGGHIGIERDGVELERWPPDWKGKYSTHRRSPDRLSELRFSRLRSLHREESVPATLLLDYAQVEAAADHAAKHNQSE